VKASAQNKLVSLESLASISRGYSFRSRIEPNATGDISLVQLRNIQSDGTLNMSEVVSASLDKVKSDYWLKPQDIVFCSRGASMPAALVPDNIGRAIAAAPVLRIRPKRKVVNPEYLVWFLNHPSLGQRHLLSIQSGSSMQMVNQRGLSEITITLPSLVVQAKIAALSTLHRQESKLLMQLQEKRSRYMDAVLMKCMQGELS